jgi:hypothetical protein
MIGLLFMVPNLCQWKLSPLLRTFRVLDKEAEKRGFKNISNGDRNGEVGWRSKEDPTT